jgi:lipoprotein-releasing system ATP-binding protein
MSSEQLETTPTTNEHADSTTDASAGSDALLEVRDIHKFFWLENKRIDVLRGANCVIKQAQTIAIVGASGAGKSTLLHILGTLDTPSQGKLFINGQDVLALTEEELATFRNQSIGFMFQAHYLLPEFSALENVMMPALINRMSKPDANARARELLDWVGLSHRFSHRPGELSGGERQRVALCRALIMRPRILLADEPTGNLDANTAEGIHTLFESVRDEWGVTPIVVTHNQALADRMQRCFRLADGTLNETTNREQDSE